MRSLPAAAVALLVLAVVVPAAGVAAQTADGSGQLPQITTVDNTTNHLAIPPDEVTATTHNRSSLDVGVAVAVGSHDLRNDHATTAFEQQFFGRETETGRDRLVDETLSDIRAQRVTLQRHNRRATRQYASGSITAREFLRQRALIDARSRQLTERLERIRTAAATAPGYSLSQDQRFRLESSRGVLKTYRGPISERIGSETAGGAEPNAVYVEASTDGYMLSTVTDGQYVRETYLGNERDQSAPDQFAERDDPLGAVNARANALYPWLYGEQYPSVQGYGRSAVYQIQADHPNGRLTAYLDGGTSNVFFETQTLELTTVDRSTVGTNANRSVQVRVQRSFESGPLLVTVTDGNTGSTTDATVSIDGRQVGSTGTDGILWTVEPRGEYTVTVTTPDGVRVTLPVSEAA